MVPIQMYLFDKWSSGNLFYSTDFGLGGDFFTDLSYYFSTNILFIINVVFIALIKIFIPLHTHNVLFWMINALIMSMIKAMIAMYCTYLYSKYISNNKWLSLVVAFLFVMSLYIIALQCIGPSLVMCLFGCRYYYSLLKESYKTEVWTIHCYCFFNTN